MDNKGFRDKYDFTITNDGNSNKKVPEVNINQVLEQLMSEDVYLDYINNRFELRITKEEDIKKIKLDSKSYYHNLKRKIILNHNLLKIFIENFYRDEFNNTRNSSYLIVTFPILVVLIFKSVSPYHPFFGMSLSISLMGPLIAFGYFFNQEMKNLSSSSSIFGKKVRQIKNEIALYNPLVKEVDEVKLNKKL